MAKSRELNPYVWAAIALASYFGGAFIAGAIIGLVAPEMLYDETALNIVAIVSSLGGLLIAWLIMEYASKRNKQKKVENDFDLLDDSYLEEL